ncbi:hypothetical protein K456DRAFT_353373 [Colletotrichum gloeosporioides 23]|nr:hypothetical protein K456DRAFT_353373 [Colletotrichum gloeosporioides 23]
MRTLPHFLIDFGFNLPCISSDLLYMNYNRKRQDAFETYICVIGLTTVEDIKRFDDKISQNKSMYHPLKLCYLLDRIYMSATSDIHTIEAHQNDTFCGTLMTSQLENGISFISTIGGLLTIDTRTYALTTNHIPETGFLPQEIQSKSEYMLNPKEVLECGDWRLALIKPTLRRPNIIRGTLPEPTSEPILSHIIESHYSFDSRIFSDSREVLIACGRSGLKQGLISKRMTFILSQGRSLQEVWLIDLGHRDFEAGDSGSWVVHKDDNALLGVLIARSYRSGYMVPFTAVRKNIEKAFGLSAATVGLFQPILAPDHAHVIMSRQPQGIRLVSLQEALRYPMLGTFLCVAAWVCVRTLYCVFYVTQGIGKSD